MNKRIFAIIFLISFSVVFESQDAFAELLFQDDFSMDPVLNGWTENFLAENSDGIHTLDPPHVGHGTEVILEKNGPDSPAPIREFSIDRIISTAGFENIQISLTAHQTNDNYEPEDFLEISVDTDGDGIFESVLKDVEIWDGVDDRNTMDTNAPHGNTLPTSTGLIQLSNNAENNPNLKIRIEARFNSQDEDYFLTEFQVIGDMIEVTDDVIGGKMLEIDNYALIVAAIDTNHLVTGFIGIALSVVGPTAWFVHRRKMNSS